MRVVPLLGVSRFFSLLSLSLALSACGGGGGGSSSPPPVSNAGGSGAGAFSVTIDRRELQIAGEEGASLATATVVASGSGTAPDAVYLGSVDLGSAIERVSFTGNGNQATFTIQARSNLAVGVYRGSVQLYACRDVQCAAHFSGSPATVPYTVTITQGFSVTPEAAQLSSLSGATASTSATVRLPASAASFSATATSPWLSVSEVTTAGFKITAGSLPPGTYSGTVLVTAAGLSRHVAVNYVVRGDATTVHEIIPSAASLSFSTAVSGVAPSKVLDVTLPSWSQELSAAIRYQNGGGDWLSLTRSGERSYTVTASAGALTAGTYQAAIVLSSGTAAQTVTVPVNFTVGAASWALDGATHFSVSADTTAAGLAGDLAVSLPGLPAQSYAAVSDSPWLTLSRSDGVTGGAPLRLAIDVPEMLKLANFKSYTAVVKFTAADSRIAPTTVAVTLDKALPRLDYVSPHTRLPGEGGIYTLRGRGFDGVVDLAQALSASGATPTQVTRVSDTELKVQLAGASSGDVSFGIRNALATPSGTAVLSVVPQGAFAYAALENLGAKGSLIFDAQRQALYAINKSYGTVMRFAYNGSTWNVSSTPLANADSLALSPDGASLVATAAPASIVLFDPLTLTRLASYAPYAVSIEDFDSQSRLAVTNNGRAYFRGVATGSGLAYFDLVAREFGTEPISVYTNFNNGPAFSISGDGSRLNIMQSASVSPALPMLYLDSGTNKVLNNPANITIWQEAAQSLRGERFVEGVRKVWDRDFRLVGNLVLPDTNYVGRTPVVSPDGTRVYVMAYHDNIFYGGAQLPRVFVFDSSTRMTGSAALPLLGYFDLADYPTCRANVFGCNMRAQGTISPDGATLFFAGDSKLVVAPVPVLTPSPQGVSIQRANAASAIVPRLTRVPLGR